MKKILSIIFVFVASLVLISCEASLPNLDIPEMDVIQVPEGFVQGVTETQVFVGNTASKTGAFGVVGVPFSAAIEAVFADYNANRPAGALEVVYITYDDETDPAVGLTNTRKLIEEDEIFALVGHVGTGTVNATLPYIMEKHIPLVYAATGINNLYFEETPGNPIFAVQPIYKTDGRIAYARAITEEVYGEAKNAQLAEDAKIGVLYTNDDAGKSIAAGIIEEARQQGREKHLVLYSFESDTIDATTKSLLNKNPDSIIVAGNQAPFNEALVALHDLGNTVPVFTSYVNTNAGSITRQAYNFDIFGSAWIDIIDPAGLNGFSAEYWAFATLMVEQNYAQYAADAFAMAGYVAAKVFLEGLARVEGPLTQAKYIAALESAPIDIPMGGQIDFTGGKRWGINSMSLSKYLAGNLEDPEASAAFIGQSPMEALADILAKLN